MHMTLLYATAHLTDGIHSNTSPQFMTFAIARTTVAKLIPASINLCQHGARWDCLRGLWYVCRPLATLG